MGSGTLGHARDTANALVINEWTGLSLVDPSSNRGGAGSSIAPSIGNALVTRYGTQQRIANLGVSGTSLIGTDGTVWGYRNEADHDDINTLYGEALLRINAFFGANQCGIIWLQGESDADSVATKANYKTAFTNMIGWFREDLGYTVPVFIIQIGRRPTGSDAGTANIQTAQEELDNGSTILLAACSYDQPLQGDNSHFDYAALDIIGARCAATIIKYLDGTLATGYRYRATAYAATVRKQINITTSLATVTQGKSGFEVFTGPYPLVPIAAGGDLNISLNSDFSQNGTVRYAYGKNPVITNVPADVIGRPLEPIHDWQNVNAYGGSIVSALTFDDTDLDFMAYFARVPKKTADRNSGAWGIYPAAAYPASMDNTGANEGYIYNAGASHYFRSTTGAQISIPTKSLVKTATSKFTFAFKIRYGITTGDYVTLFTFQSGGTLCDTYLRAINGTRAIEFRTYVGGVGKGYANAAAGTLPASESDISLIYQIDGVTMKIFLNGIEVSYGARTDYSGENQTWTGLNLFSYSAMQCYWCAFFNDAISQERITALAALPNNLNLYGYASPDNTGMALRTAIPVPIITAPTGAKIGQTITLTYSNLIDLYSGASLTNAKIELSRDNKSTWTTLTSTATGGTYSWTITGDAATQCYLRVSDPADATNTADSGQFTIASSGGGGLGGAALLTFGLFGVGAWFLFGRRKPPTS
jgi:hypothetical protein